MNKPAPAPSTEESRYLAAWQKLRWNMFFSRLLPITAIPAIVVIGWMLSFIVHGFAGYIVVALVWIAAWVVCNLNVGNFRCPRCGGAFFIDSGGAGRNPTSGVCMHCGLRKYAPSG